MVDAVVVNVILLIFRVVAPEANPCENIKKGE